MYNSCHFHKLDFWNMMSSSEHIAGHLPMTRVYNSIHDIDEMLESYEALFFKPINRTRAFGIMRVTKSGNGYAVQKKFDEKPKVFSSNEKAARFIESIRKGRKYLVQEGIELLNVDNCYMDFRVIMQKNYLLEWQCTGIIASIGKPGGVCSNYTVGAKYMTFEKFFDKYFSLSKRDMFLKKQEIIALCRKACAVLDESGKHYADLGIDVGLDINLKPWVFELNNRRHEHKMCIYAKDYDSYFRSVTNPVGYGVRLSGFDVL
jgi:hypothetical protein